MILGTSPVMTLRSTRRAIYLMGKLYRVIEVSKTAKHFHFDTFGYFKNDLFCIHHHEVDRYAYAHFTMLQNIALQPINPSGDLRLVSSTSLEAGHCPPKCPWSCPQRHPGRQHTGRCQMPSARPWRSSGSDVTQRPG